MWWWIDRWRKSSAYAAMTLEEQGAYRNLLDEAHLRGGLLSSDERVLAKACGDAHRWRRVRAKVLAHFTQTPEGWRHETLDAVLHESQRLARNQRAYRRRRAGHGPDNGTDNGGDNGPITEPITRPITVRSRADNKRDNNADIKAASPSPSPSLSTRSDPSSRSRSTYTAPAAPLLPPLTARSKRPIFSGQRLTVFEWMFDDCDKTLGPHAEAFDLHRFFFDLDARFVADGTVVPKRDGGAVLQAELLAECQRRGLPLHLANGTPDKDARLSPAALTKAVAKRLGFES
jgi:uncharacterized protein YdaU (DUF1376 family)